MELKKTEWVVDHSVNCCRNKGWSAHELRKVRLDLVLGLGVRVRDTPIQIGLSNEQMCRSGHQKRDGCQS